MKHNITGEALFGKPALGVSLPDARFFVVAAPFKFPLKMLYLTGMTLLWYGQACFKIESRDTVIVIDPYAKEIGLTPPRFRADCVLVTHGHIDHANTESIQGEPFVIQGPGEYEVRGVSARGIRTYHDAVEGKERGENTVYIIEAEGIKICHFGDYGEGAVRDEIIEAIGDIDILLVPVGGTYTIDGKQAAQVVKAIEPRIVIPMHYKIPGLVFGLSGAEPFLKEVGAKEAEKMEKLTIKKKDLPETEMRVVVLKRAGAA